MNTKRTAEVAQLVAQHLDLPRRVASTVHARVRPHVDMEELISLGNQGLAEAAHRYDARLGKFETFAWWRIHGAIVDGLRRSSPLPRSTWRKLLAAHAANDQHAVAAVKAGAALRRSIPSSFEQLCEDGFDVAGATAEDTLDRERALAGLREALAELPEVERTLVERHYWEGRDLRAAGEELGMSKSWASRLHARALGRLRAVMAAHAPER